MISLIPKRSTEKENFAPNNIFCDVFTAQTGCWNATVSKFAKMRVHQRLHRTHKQNYGMMRVWIALQAQAFADIREQLKYNWLFMSSWQYGEHILAIYNCVEGFPLMLGETFSLWKTLLEHGGQNFFEDTFRNIIHVEHRRILKETVNRPISSSELFMQTIPLPGRDRQNLPQEMQ